MQSGLISTVKWKSTHSPATLVNVQNEISTSVLRTLDSDSVTDHCRVTGTEEQTLSEGLPQLSGYPLHGLGRDLGAKVAVKWRWSSPLLDSFHLYCMGFIMVCNHDTNAEERVDKSVLAGGNVCTCCMCPSTFFLQSNTPLPSSEYSW